MAVWMGLLLAGALLAAADLDPSAQDPPSSSDDFKGLTESVTGRLILPNSLALGPPRPEHTELSRELLTDSICRKTPAAVDEICTARSVSEMPELPLCKGPVRDRLCRRRPRQLSQTLETASAAEVTEAGAACKGMGYSPCRFHSVQHEDAVLFNAFFKDRVGGVFIESGASTQADNTQFYEVGCLAAVLLRPLPLLPHAPTPGIHLACWLMVLLLESRARVNAHSCDHRTQCSGRACLSRPVQPTTKRSRRNEGGRTEQSSSTVR